MKILTISHKKEEKFLRQKTAEFDPALLKDKKRAGEINDLIKKMREAVTEAIGIGLSANQVGLNLRFFVAQLPRNYAENNAELRGNSLHESALSQRKSAFYAIFNPEIIKFSEKKSIMEEGCLSVPGVYGLVERSEKITLAGYDKNAKKLKIKAFGLLSRVFQHEMDHLNGILFIDKAVNLRKAINNK
ncbi:MAG: peptide deformylase [bacterium]|nr:peptide deformylase [bacterium]